MTRKYDAKKAALTRKRNKKKEAVKMEELRIKMLREQKEREHTYEIEVEVNYYATERGNFTVEAETREEAEEIAIADAQNFTTNNGQIVGCEGYSDGDFSIFSIERTDGKDVDGADDEDDGGDPDMPDEDDEDDEDA